MSNSDDDYNDDGFKFVAEVNVYERAGLGGAAAILGGNANIGGKLGDIQKKLNNMFQDPIERFAVTVDAISRYLNDCDEGFNISEDERVEMLIKIQSLQHVEHKNASAYILGFLASRGGRGMEPKVVQKVFDKGIPCVKNVDKAAIIRYARLWMELK